MSWMSGMLILSYRLEEVINSYVLHFVWIWRIIHISATRCPSEMGFESKCSILNGQVIYFEKNQNWILPTCDSFLLIMSQMCITGMHIQFFLFFCLGNLQRWKFYCNCRNFCILSLFQKIYCNCRCCYFQTPSVVHCMNATASAQSPKFLPANHFCQLLRVTRKRSCTSAGNTQMQLHFRDD